MHDGVEAELEEFGRAKQSVMRETLTAHARSTIDACQRRNEVLQGLLQQFWDEPTELAGGD